MHCHRARTDARRHHQRVSVENLSSAIPKAAPRTLAVAPQSAPRPTPWMLAAPRLLVDPAHPAAIGGEGVTGPARAARPARAQLAKCALTRPNSGQVDRI